MPDQRNYFVRLKQGFSPLDLDTRWGAPAIRTISQVLENPHGRSFDFPNFILPRDVLKIMDRACADSVFFPPNSDTSRICFRYESHPDRWESVEPTAMATLRNSPRKRTKPLWE